MTGIALYSPKSDPNWGNILRVAYNYEVDFVATIGARYKRQAADTPHAGKHIPIFRFNETKDFLASYPKECEIINLEVDNSHPLESFQHPRNGLYVFGPEDGSIPADLLKEGVNLRISSRRCLNQATCAANVIFHRHLQFFKPEVKIP